MRSVLASTMLVLAACSGGTGDSPDPENARGAPHTTAPVEEPELQPARGCVRWEPPGTGCETWAPPPQVEIDGTDDELRARASAVMEEARTHWENGHFTKGVAAVERAYTIVPEPLLVYNIADMHERNQDHVCALDAYRAFIALAPDSDYVAKAEAAIVRLEAELAAGRPVLTDGARYCPEP